LKGSSDAALANQKQQLYAQTPGINQQYDALNSQAYTNARLSALGNNEGLASLGLAGNAYAGPQSGYSESSRVAQDTALGNSVNASNLARQNALMGIDTQIGQAGSAASAALLGQQATLAGQQASAEQNQSQFNAQMGETQAAREQSANQFGQQMNYNAGQDAFTNALNEANVTGLYGGQQTMAARSAALQQALSEAGLTGTYNGQQTLEAQQLESQQEQQQMDNAMNRINLMGYVDEYASQITGLPVGTKSWQANTWKQEYDLARKRSSGSGSKTMSDADLLAAIMSGLGTGTATTAAATQAATTYGGMSRDDILKKLGAMSSGGKVGYGGSPEKTTKKTGWELY
jgi:hypothetical protein